MYAFFVMTGANIIFLITLIVAGIQLIITKRQTLGIRISNVLFISVIVYEIVISFIWMLGGIWNPADTFSRSVAGATGIGNMGIAPFLQTYYVIVALIALNLIHRKISAAASKSSSTPM
jgi:hypothetical protein